MPFVKLDCGMLDSTLWTDRDAREIFVTALLMAEPVEIKEAMNQIQVRCLDNTGFVVPPGWYGFVHAAGTGITRRAGLETEQGLSALERLGSEDKESRTPDFDGRRLVRVDGGYVILNFIKYREKDATSALRSKRWRERQKDKTTRVSSVTQRVIRHQAEAEAEAEVQGKPPCLSSTEQILRDKELTRVEAEIKRIREFYGNNGGWSDKDKVEIKRLKERREELKAMLQMAV